ncbi:AAA family ATPase [Streptomyces sp. BE20]|uniref:helix-turn-helix transcriptional regulator n=1 Tax=Streptomyces sp. BE20 TaxID=3002525 RepID=UPI002E77A4DD|nr:AAA family ATPase [Streptomyces sp. BE20]MEE1824711.1 AAA family ATPase [Streptomyces sp. BE20]
MTTQTGAAGDASRRKAPPFVGRERELGALLGAARARPSVVLVEGEAGIGKSRLVAEAVDELRGEGVRVVTGSCHPLREPLAFGPVVEALRRSGPWMPGAGRLDAPAGVLAVLLPELADRLPPAQPWPSGQSAPRDLVARGVRVVLAAIAPVVLVVEDVHWADEATRELLLLLGRDLPADTALVLTYRARDVPGRGPVLGAAFRRPPGTGGAELALPRLSPDDLRAMARSVLAEAATPGLLHTLVERSEGLPLVIEEDLITLGARLGDGALGVPRSLREVFAERIDQLSPEAVALVNVSAVLAVPAGEQLLADCAGLPPGAAGEALLAALAASVLREYGPDSYGFAHVLGRQAQYDNLPGPVRHRLHRRVLDVLEALPEPPLVQISHHARALGDTAVWLDRAMAAADRAVALGDRGTAAALLHQVLDEPRLPSALHARAALALARTAWDTVEYTRTIATLRRIVAGPGLPVAARGEIRLDLGLMLLNQAADPSGEAEIERAVEELEGRRPEQAARAMSLLAMWETSRFSAAEQRAWLDRAAATIADSPDRAVHASVAANRVTVLAAQGRREAAGLLAGLPRTDDDPEVVRHTARALVNTAEVGICLGQDARAADCTEEALALSRHHHAHALIVHCRSYRLLLSWLAGEWAHWDERYAAFLAEYVDEPLAVDDLLATAEGVMAAARGRVSRAVERFDRVLTRDGARMNVNALGAAAGLARIQLARGDAGAAWSTVGAYLPLLPRKEEWVYALGLVPVAVETALQRGDDRTAAALVEDHGAGVEGLDAPGAVAEQYLCRGLLAAREDRTQAAQHFDRARLQWSGIGRPYHAALADEQAAQALAGLHPAEAVQRLTRAVGVHDRLGATTDSARCRHLLLALGQSRPQSRGRAGYGDELSPREQQVARLLGDGATNKDIAAALFLSPRTVEQHVAKVLLKLRTTREAVRNGPA